MRERFVRHAVLGILLICQLSVCFGKEAPDPADPNRYLNAVREFADNVLLYGRDTYGPKQTPLFVDGLNVNTHEPVKWIAPNGDRWILSNLASQQNLFRTLDGLTRITGDPKYKQAAMDAIKYAFENLRSPNGLLYWGIRAAYDAQGDSSYGSNHVLKSYYPYYDLMWEVSPGATRKFVEAFWSAHIKDWSNLDMDRIGYLNVNLKEPWNDEYKAGPVFFQGRGRSMLCTGSDLFYAAGLLTKLSGDKEPLIWAKRLASRYVETRDPHVGISGSKYTYTKSDEAQEQFGEDFKGHLLLTGTLFPPQPAVGHPDIKESILGYLIETPGTDYDPAISPWVCCMLLGDLLGNDGRDFIQWGLEELTALGRVAYRKQDNVFIPMLIDGTNLEGYVCKKDGLFAWRGIEFKAIPAVTMDFWSYALAYRITGDQFMWQMARNIASGYDLGDIGITREDYPRLKATTDCWCPYALLGFLELYKKTGNQAFLHMAQRIGDNLLVHRFHKGFFVASNRHIYSKFNAIDSLVLLNLHVALKAQSTALPVVWPSMSIFNVPYRNQSYAMDSSLIYTLTDSSEPPKSLHEAALEGDLDGVNAMITKGVNVNAWDQAILSALHYACRDGHTEVAKLLIAKGANVDAGPDFTPLHYAAQGGHKEVAEFLIVKGAEVNTKNNNGQTPLDIAISRNQKDIVELLLAKGAEVSSIHIAAAIGDLAKVRGFLEKGADVNMRDAQRKTALHIAATEGHKEIVELLLASGADVNAGGYYNKTAAEYAMGADHREIVELLISKGADISPLHFALYIKDQAKAKSLIESGADVNKRTPYGTTPLDRAVGVGLKDIAELLIAKGANVNAKDNWDWTPLHSAAEKGHRDIVELLLAKGADVNAKDGDGLIPLWYAEDEGNTEIAELLRKHGAKE